MRIAILGAGSLGSVVGGALAAVGNDVVLVARNREHVDAVNRNGLLLRETDGTRTVRVAAALPEAAGAPADLVVVLTKSSATGDALAGAAGLIGAHTVVMSLQNGLGHEDIIARAVGKARVVAGKTYLGGLLTGPGEVVAGIRGKETIIGELDGTKSPRIARIAAAFNEAGLATDISENILGAMWDKLFINVATGAVSAITRLPYGDLYAVPEVEATAMAAVSEAMAVARAKGIGISSTDPRAAWLKAAHGLPHEFKASMLQSLERGERTEIDFINGSVVRAGAEAGVPTPVNSTLVACVKGIERALDLAVKAAR
ncbi:MAG: 2-dehydropantoate 2-reductase [Hyphomicrobiaceae bacterium]